MRRAPGPYPHDRPPNAPDAPFTPILRTNLFVRTSFFGIHCLRRDPGSRPVKKACFAPKEKNISSRTVMSLSLKFNLDVGHPSGCPTSLHGYKTCATIFPMDKDN